MLFEFANLRAFGAFMAYVPYTHSGLRTLRDLRALRAFVHYVPSRFTSLDLYAPYLLTRLITHVSLNVTKSFIKGNFKMF